MAYAQGYRTDEDTVDPALEQAAVAAAVDADVAVIFAGLPERYESEGYDRTTLAMPENQNHLIAAVAAVQPNTVVVLHNGSAVEMPWLNDVPAVLELYLAGDGAGEAAVDLLYGAVNPSGKLAETFPRKLSDTPAYLSFPRRAGNQRLHRGRICRLPLLRHEGGGRSVPLRSRPVLHDL